MKNLGIYSNGCYTFRGVKINNIIYGRVIKSRYDHIFEKGTYRMVTADTFTKIPRKLWKVLEKMD
jgi:hypothetical protein